MGHGLPSWKKYRAFGPVYEEIRLTEHAARLGSISTFDRRGDIVLMDSFENGLILCSPMAAGSGGSVVPSVARARSGGVSALFTTRNIAMKEADIVYYRPKPVMARMGFEVSFTLNVDLACFEVDIIVYTGGKYYVPQVRYDLANDKFEYFDAGGKWQPLITGLALREDDHMFHTLKLVADFENEVYCRFMINDNIEAMPTIGLSSDTSDLTAHLYVLIRTTASGATNTPSYVDDVIITQNEP